MSKIIIIVTKKAQKVSKKVSKKSANKPGRQTNPLCKPAERGYWKLLENNWLFVGWGFVHGTFTN